MNTFLFLFRLGTHHLKLLYLSRVYENNKVINLLLMKKVTVSTIFYNV